MRVYFIDLIHPSGVNNTNVMPLGMGLIAAFCQRNLSVPLEAEIFKLPDDLNRALNENPLPDVACISNWAWNQRLSLAYARHLKRLNPEMPIIMGGLNLPLDREGREAFLRAHPEVDFYVIGEGEGPVWRLLDELDSCGLRAEHLKHYHPGGCGYIERIGVSLDRETEYGVYRENKGHRLSVLDDIPSPYLAGLMDKFFAQGLRPIIETARGCPFSCVFCAGAVESHNLVKHHSPAYIEAELDYIARKVKAAGISPDLIYADLNFGMFPQDIEKARIFRRTIDRYGWPRILSGPTGKARAERVLDAVGIINRGPAGEDQGILKFAASLQSTDPEVLSRCRRRNFPLERLETLMAARKKGGPGEYFSELIVGLPGDTREKHFQSLKDCIDRLRLNLIVSHQLMLLPGTPLATPEGRATHGLKTRWRPLVGCAGVYRIGAEEVGIAELEEIVTETATLSLQDHLDCREMVLEAKVYLDRDSFIEVLGLVRRLGLSCFALLLRVREEWRRRPALSYLLSDFRTSTVLPFFWDKNGAEQFTAKTENLQGLLQGDLGTNELLVYRAKAMIEYEGAIHEALLEASRAYLASSNIPLDPFLFDEYLRQAVRWSRLRKFSPLEWDDTEGYGSVFEFDFLAAAEQGFEVLPEEVALPVPRHYRFQYMPEQRARIRSLIDWWIPQEATPASAAYNWGRFYHIVNTRTLDRTPVLAEEEYTVLEQSPL